MKEDDQDSQHASFMMLALEEVGWMRCMCQLLHELIELRLHLHRPRRHLKPVRFRSDVFWCAMERLSDEEPTKPLSQQTYVNRV
jgi:hypothetical protein